MSTANFSHFQVGQNATATQNFTVTQGADGSGKIARGNQGATTQDIITWDSAGKVTFPLPPIHTQYSMVRLNTANGYGSTNTMIRRFTNVVTNVGSDITYADSATLGASFTINTNGVYAISYSDISGTQIDFGISLNSTQLTTAIQNIALADRLIYTLSPLNAYPGSVTIGGIYLPQGSVIRAHANSSNTGTLAFATFTITRVS